MPRDTRPALDMTAVLFGVAVATMAEALLGEAAGDDNGDGCPQGDPRCYGPTLGDHQLCQYVPPGCPVCGAPTGGTPCTTNGPAARPGTPTCAALMAEHNGRAAR